MTIIRFLDTCHPFGYPLLICSVILVAAILYHQLNTGSNRFLRRIRARMQRTGSTPETLRRICAESRHPLADDILFVLDHPGDADLEPRLEARLRCRIDAERAGMAVISVITNIAPMLGILGTAWGLVDIFGVFGTAEAQAGIAEGISKALYTTIFGLAIAVPGIIALTCFERALERRAAVICEFFAELTAELRKH